MANVKVPPLLHKMSLASQKAWYKKNNMEMPSTTADGKSAAQAKKDVGEINKKKAREATIAAAVATSKKNKELMKSSDRVRQMAANAKAFGGQRPGGDLTTASGMVNYIRSGGYLKAGRLGEETVEEAVVKTKDVNKQKLKNYVRGLGTKAAIAGKVPFDQINSPLRAGRKVLKQEEVQIDEVTKKEAESTLGGTVKEKPKMPPGKQPAGYRYVRSLARKAMKAGIKKEEVALDEMDKSQPSSSRGAEGLALGKKTDPVKPDKVKSDALKLLQKQYKKVKEEVELDEANMRFDPEAAARPKSSDVKNFLNRNKNPRAAAASKKYIRRMTKLGGLGPNQTKKDTEAHMKAHFEEVSVDEEKKPDASMAMTNTLKMKMLSDKDKKTLGKVADLMASQKKKSVKEGVNMKYIEEKLTASDPASKWISDFVKSDNPKFAGKSKKERINQALGAYYAAKRGTNEEVEQTDEAVRVVDVEKKGKLPKKQDVRDRLALAAKERRKITGEPGVKGFNKPIGFAPTKYMDTSYVRAMKEEEAFKKVAESMDAVGREDKDVDNDGDSDKTDLYLSKRRKAIGNAIRKKVAGKMEK
jgi:hypothetical protein